jgi:hypothetical protein
MVDPKYIRTEKSNSSIFDTKTAALAVEQAELVREHAACEPVEVVEQDDAED